tara:strand:+ start:5511 stop:6752 length:1242 start_codon:yes stop_codon:yes gene_type:complete
MHPAKLITYFNLFFVLLPSVWIFDFFPQTNFYNVALDSKEKTLFLFYIFYITFQLIWLMFGSIKIRAPIFIIRPNIRFLAMGLIFISLATKLYLYSTGYHLIEDKYESAEKIPAVLQYINNSYLIGFSLFVVYYYKIKSVPESSPPIAFFRVMMAICIAIAIFEGRRFGVIYPILLAVAAQAYFGILNYRKLFKVGIIMISLFLTVTALRLAQAVQFASGLDATDISMVSIAQSSIDLEYTEFLNSIVSRLGNHIIVTNAIVDQIDSGDIEPSYNALSLAAYSIIPRMIWREKPSLSIGNTIGKELGLIHQKNERTKINPSWVGDAYYSMGYIGVVLAAVIFSILLRVPRMLFRQNTHLGGVVYAQSMLLIISGFQMELAFSLNNYIKYFIMVAFILFLLKLLSIKPYNFKAT